jgi:acyl-CoA reductase-like NAD-dependent aldehyde dehydrogenase
VFAELAPRMMKMKESMQALPVEEREQIKHASQAAMDAFAARNADADTIETLGKACEQSSPAFAEIARKVMFVKKH